MEPRALTKAESLKRFATSQGSPLDTFQLVLSDAEGLELIDWLMAQSPPNELLSLDVQIAHRTRDPWPVLDCFVLLGLHMARADRVLN